MAAPDVDRVETLVLFLTDCLLRYPEHYSPDELLSASCTLTTRLMASAITLAAQLPEPRDVRPALQGLLERMIALLADDTPGRVQ